MNKLKICVYAICKNEEQFVERWMDSMKEADLVVVTDTGSTDATVQRLRRKGAQVYIEEVAPWRFDVARNISLCHVPEEVDICVCTDLDELFEKGWRQQLERAWTPGAKMGRYLYNWSVKPDGTPGVQFYYSKIHTRRDFIWMNPVHEYLRYIGEEPLERVTIGEMVLNHHPDPKKSRGSYLELLELGFRENPNDDRSAYYLGREYLYKGEWSKCIETLKKHLSLPASTWREERCASMRWLAKSCHKLKNETEAYGWYYRAVAEAPHMREPYVEFAKMGYELGDWPLVFHMTGEALKIKERFLNYTTMNYAWDHTPDDLAAISCYRLGMFDRSLEHAKRALELSPWDERLRNNLELIRQKVEKTQKPEGLQAE